MTLRRSFFIIGLVVLTALGSGYFVARASGQECRLEDRLGELAAIKKNPELDYREAIKAELAIRKDILKTIVACGKSEVDDLESKLKEARLDPENEDLRRLFVDQLSAAKGFYDEQAAKIDSLGIRGSQELARSLKEWRAGSYAPLAERTLSFIVWSKNQDLFKTARARFTDIRRTVQRLKLGENDAVRELFEKAGRTLESAEAMNTSARNSLGELSPSANFLASIKNSLDALSKTYQIFADLSEAVQKIIPH